MFAANAARLVCIEVTIRWFSLAIPAGVLHDEILFAFESVVESRLLSMG